MATFEVGALVQLRSGSPTMTVCEAASKKRESGTIEYVGCMWWEKDRSAFNTQTIPAAALVPGTPTDGDSK